MQHEATIGPIVDDDYRRIMKERTKAAFDVSNSRKSQMMSDKASKQKGMIATQGNQWDVNKVQFLLTCRKSKYLWTRKNGYHEK